MNNVTKCVIGLVIGIVAALATFFILRHQRKVRAAKKANNTIK